MSVLPGRDNTEPRHLVEAAAWRARLTEIGADNHEEFEAWRSAHPLNEAAWRQVQGPWTFLGEQANAPEMLELRRTALAEAHEAGHNRWTRRSLAPRPIRYALVAGALLAAIGTFLAWNLNRPDVYETAAGERRVIRLEDGSQVALDSRSELRVRYTAKARELALTTGQARFDVAHDPARPFSVDAGGQQVVATGTSFNVDLLGPRVLVTLIEGHVVVAGTGRGIELAAGEQLTVSPEAPPRVVPISIERATAWQNGRLVFENEPLSTVVMRVGRYSARPLRVEDANAGQMRISGVFDTGDVEGFVATVTAYLPVNAERAADGTLELHSRD